MSIFKKKTKIFAYALISTEIKNKFLTITKDTKEAIEYSMMLLKLKYHEHFGLWCDARNLDKNSEKSWLSYYENSVPAAEKAEFQIIKVAYDIDNLLAILRMFGNCFPLGCSFDTDVEKIYFNAIVEETLQKKAEEKVKEQAKEN